MTAHSIDTRGRITSDGTLPLSAASTQSPSMRDGSSSTVPDDESEWPQTWRAYACLLGSFFLMFNSWGLVNAYGTWSSYYVGHSLEGTGQLQLNLIGSTQSFFVLLLSNPVGRLLDANYSRQIIGFGTFFIPFGLFLLSVVHPSDATVAGNGNFRSIWATQGLVVGLGMAPFFVSSSQVAATWFPKRRGLAVGYVACGASVAGVVYPVMLRYLIMSLGFNNAVRCVAALTTVTCLYSFIFCSPNPAHEHHAPDNWVARKTWWDSDVNSNKAFWWFVAAVAFMFFGFYPVFFNIEEWASVGGYGFRGKRGESLDPGYITNRPIETYWLLAIMNGASTIGRMILAHFSDKLGALNLHTATQFICSLLTLILWPMAKSESAAVAFCVVFGLFSGTVIGCPPASIANILSCTYDTADTKHFAKKKLGHWTGMMYSFAAVPALCGPLIAGYLITHYKTYLTVQMWSGASLFISFICMCIARWNLRCEDGETVHTKFARLRGRHVDSFQEKGTGSKVTSPETLSQAPTRVPSNTPSRQTSSEKLDRTDTIV